MRSNIKYANILIIAIAIAYFIIGGMNYFIVFDFVTSCGNSTNFGCVYFRSANNGD